MSQLDGTAVKTMQNTIETDLYMYKLMLKLDKTLQD